MLLKIQMVRLGKLFNGSLQSAGQRLDLSPASFSKLVLISAISLIGAGRFLARGACLAAGPPFSKQWYSGGTK